MTNVICLKQGRIYGPEYVNKLYSMFARNTTVPYRFICFTEDRYGIDDDIETRPIPYQLKGWWCKVGFFQPPDWISDDQIVCVDLDVIITGNMDWLVAWRGDFAIVHEIRGAKFYNGSLWSLRPGYGTQVWEKFFECGDEVMKRLYSDQEWIRECIPAAGNLNALFPGKIYSFGTDYWHVDERERVYPEGAAIWLFHNFPKPIEVWKKVPWVREHWR